MEVCGVYSLSWIMSEFKDCEKSLVVGNSSTAAAVTFITFVQDLKRKTKAWGPMIELCASGEKTLERFRYQFPDDWLYSDQLRGEWSAYNEILRRKNDSIQEQLGEYTTNKRHFS
jgi:dynein heavy chain 1, cytosolic